jgi:hypothetical protein
MGEEEETLIMDSINRMSENQKDSRTAVDSTEGIPVDTDTHASPIQQKMHGLRLTKKGPDYLSRIGASGGDRKKENRRDDDKGSDKGTSDKGGGNKKDRKIEEKREHGVMYATGTTESAEVGLLFPEEDFCEFKTFTEVPYFGPVKPVSVELGGVNSIALDSIGQVHTWYAYIEL